MRSCRFVALALTVTFALRAQVGVVQNAALYQQQSFLLAPNIAYVSGPVLTEGFGPVSLFLSPFAGSNIIAPRMLAVLSYFAQVISVISGQSPVTTALPVTAALSIRPVGSTSAIPVTVITAVAGAITFVVPAGIPLGGAELLYKIDDQPTQWTLVNVVQSSFAFFRTGLGGPAVAQTIAADGSLATVGLTTPAQPGQTLFLTGSGLGYGSTVTATIGGIAAPVLAAGPHPTQAGHDQILIPIPASVPDGCYIPVNITVNQTTLTTTISKTSDGSPCRHPWQLSLDDMKTLDNGGSLANGEISLTTALTVVTSTVASRTESAGMRLSSIDASGIAAYFPPFAPAPGCVATPSNAAAIAVFRNGDFSGTVPPLPDIGASITLQNSAATLALPGNAGYFSWSAPPSTDGAINNPATSIPGGVWTWRSGGGKDLLPSSFPFTLPSGLQLNGGAPVVVKRAQDLTISWNRASFDPAATVFLNLGGSTGPPVNCTAAASAGTLTIPAALLSANVSNTIGTLTVSLNQPGSAVPHANLKLQSGATLLMLVSYSGSDSRPVLFQ
ncbi:MAG TPA: hypothetical protein VHZ74_01920 [Bryobacteraceae bacterium]|nr:hypothetical protein [Bryobacteraceae bacterium]